MDAIAFRNKIRVSDDVVLSYGMVANTGAMA